MKYLSILFIAGSILTSGCGPAPRSAEEAQASPTATTETIFYLIQNEKFDALPAVIADDADAKSQELGNLYSADEVTKKQTREYFESASLNGEPVIDGDRATVKVNLGHKGTFEETFEMVKRDGKWYLYTSTY